MTSGLPCDVLLFPCLSFFLSDKAEQGISSLTLGGAVAKTFAREGLGNPFLQGHSVFMEQVDFVDLEVGEGEGYRWVSSWSFLA